MEVIIKRFDSSLPLPKYQTAGAAALDLCSRETLTIAQHSLAYVPLNVALQVPVGYFVLVAARSSLHKMGLLLINGIGVGDYDYRGDADEYQAALYNFTAQAVQIKKGDRLVQMLVLPIEKIQLTEVKKFNTSNRGGWGSTGRR